MKAGKFSVKRKERRSWGRL